jgi:tetratricopeptide (TPR) repeat protein
MAGVALDRTAEVMGELTRASLATEERPGRFSLHDLVRAYAAELRDDADEQAVVRLRDHYLQTAYVADGMFAKAGDRPRRPDALPGIVIHPVDSYEAAVAWFDDEHDALLGLIEQAPADWLWRTAWVMRYHLDWGGYWDDLAAVSRIAERQDSVEGRAYGLRGLARAASQRGRQDEAVSQLDRALALFRQIRDETAVAYTHRQLAGVLQLAGRDGEAVNHAESALELFRAAGEKTGEGGALVALAWALTRSGRFQQAIDVGMQALPIAEASGQLYSTALVCQAIGRASHELGRFDDAISYRHKGIEVLRATMASTMLMRSNITIFQVRLAEAYRAAGRLAEADCVLREALGVFHVQVTEYQLALGQYDAARTAALRRATGELYSFVTEESGPGWYERARELMAEMVHAAEQAGIEVQSLESL